MNTRWHDLIIDRLPDGGIHLEQQAGCEEPSVIHLHPVQLRLIAETFGLAAPSYPTDELTKRLAEQLCTILRELEDERHRSHWLDMTYTKLDAWCSALPNDIFPHHVWDDSAEDAASASKTIYPCSAKDQAKKTHPSAIAEGGEQLGLQV